MSPISEYLKEITYGGNDGVVTTFAVVAGFSGAALQGSDVLGLSFATVLLFGFANLFADGLSMGLGDYLAERADADVYNSAKRKERREIDVHTNSEAAETHEILLTKGISSVDADAFIELYKKYPDYWTEWMMHYELEMSDPSHTNPVLTALATFLSFLAFGLIPLLPFFISDLPAATAFQTSAGLTAVALILIGYLRYRVTDRGLLRSVGESLLVGGLSASFAYLVGVYMG